MGHIPLGIFSEKIQKDQGLRPSWKFLTGCETDVVVIQIRLWALRFQIFHT